MLVAHLAAALVTHAASLPANVQTAGASKVNLLKKKRKILVQPPGASEVGLDPSFFFFKSLTSEAPGV